MLRILWTLLTWVLESKIFENGGQSIDICMDRVQDEKPFGDFYRRCVVDNFRRHVFAGEVDDVAAR